MYFFNVFTVKNLYLSFHLTNDDELGAFYHVAKNTRNRWYTTLIELETLMISEINNDQIIISRIDTDLNILYYIKDAIKNYRKSYDTSSFRDVV